MPNLLYFVQQPYFILTLLIVLGVVLLIIFLLVNYLGKDPYSIGKRKAKKLARLLLSTKASKNQEKGLDYEQLKKQSQKISEEVFEIGFTHERNDAHREIETYEKEIEKLQTELQRVMASLNQQDEGTRVSYEKQQSGLRGRIAQIETELRQVRSKEAMSARDSTIRKKSLRYTLLEAASRVSSVLSGSLKTLESDLLWFGMFGVFLLLLAGEFYIMLGILRDLMPTLRLTDSVFLYIGSGTLALVFLVLFEFFIQYLEKRSTEDRERVGIITIWAIGVIGALLFLVYLLIISVSIFPDSFGGRLIDAILRILFLPLVIAAALIFQKIRNQYGFQFLLNPFKFLVGSVVYAFVVALLPFEFLMRILQGQAKNLRSNTPFEQIKERELVAVQNENAGLLKEFEQDGEQIKRKQTYIENKIQQKIQALRNAKQNSEAYLSALRQGCADAVFDEMYKKVGQS